MSGPGEKASSAPPPGDWRPYAGRWVALIGGRVAGVGESKSEAYSAAKGSRPKEEPAALFYVEPESSEAGLAERVSALFAPDSVAERARRILLAGAERSYLVGGAARDAILGRPAHDLDFAVEAGALALGRQLADANGWGFYAMDIERGVARVVARDAAGERIHVDIATLYGGTIETDLAQRDFTLNALAVEMQSRRLMDLHGGMEDLRQRRLRQVAPDAIARDPIRALRAVRQAGELGLRLEPDTEASLRREGPGLAQTSPERIREEATRILRLPAAAALMGQLDGYGLLQHVWPDLPALQGVTQGPPHRLDAWEHTLLTLARLEQILAFLYGRGGDAGWLEPLLPLAPALRRHLDAPMADERPRWLVLKQAALLHDIGKPATRSVGADGRIHFLRHEERGAVLAGAALSRLHFSAAEVDLAALVVGQHTRPLGLLCEESVSPLAAHRYFRDLGAAGVDVALLLLADIWALAPGASAPAQGPAARQVALALWSYWMAQDGPEKQKPLVSGGDVMEHCGLPPGPQVGEWLRRIREEQVAGRLTNREDALRWAARRIQEVETRN